MVSLLGHSTESAFEAARASRSAVCRLDFPFIDWLAAPIGALVARFNGADQFNPRKLRMLSNSFAFGGTNAVLGLSAAP